MLWWIAQNVAVTLALAALVWGVCRTFRIGPVARHALWLVVLIKMLTPPLVAWPWAVGEPAWRSPAPLVSSGHSPVLPPPSAAPMDLDASHVDADPDRPLEPPITLVIPRTGEVSVHDLLPVPMTPAPELHVVEIVQTAQMQPPPATSPDWLARIALVLGVTWAIGTLAFLTIEVIRAARMMRLVRRGRPADGPLLRCVEQLSRRLSIRPVRVVCVPELASPAVWGLGRPVLLWPMQFPVELATESVKGLVLHELAHVRRRDHWVGWLELAAGALWWWNPLYWYVRHQVRENAELACDGWVVNELPGGRRAYAEGLLSVCEVMSRQSAPMPAVGLGTGGRRFLERRLAMIMKERIGLRLPWMGIVSIALIAMTALPAWSRKPDDAPTGGEASSESSEGTTGAEAVVEVSGFGEASARDAAHSARDDEANAISPDGRILHAYRRWALGGEADRESELRRELINVLHKLREQAAAAGRAQELAAIDQRLAILQAEDHVDLTANRGSNGARIRLAVVGRTGGSIWGGSDGVYTDDSDVGTAAVHAGVLRPGQRGTVEVEILPGRDSYDGCEKNGVTSSPYREWEGSYRIVQPVRNTVTVRVAPGTGTLTIAPPRQVSDSQKLVIVLREVIGTAEGSVWGDGVYTDDSSVGAAAVHAGLIKAGQRATVVMQMLGGRDSYHGSARNGVTSSAYGPWTGSFQLLGTVAAQNAAERLRIYGVGGSEGTGAIQILPAPSGTTPRMLPGPTPGGTPMPSGTGAMRSPPASGIPPMPGMPGVAPTPGAMTPPGAMPPRAMPAPPAPGVGSPAPRTGAPQAAAPLHGYGATDAMAAYLARRLDRPAPSPNPVQLSDFRGKQGISFTLTLTGSDRGPLWGDGVYTDDSHLATAAVHAGALKPGELGTVRVTILPGRDEYSGSPRNGVISRPYGPWEGSFRIERADNPNAEH